MAQGNLLSSLHRYSPLPCYASQSTLTLGVIQGTVVTVLDVLLLTIMEGLSRIEVHACLSGRLWAAMTTGARWPIW
jgi:hypothetical protein